MLRFCFNPRPGELTIAKDTLKELLDAEADKGSPQTGKLLINLANISYLIVQRYQRICISSAGAACQGAEAAESAANIFRSLGPEHELSLLTSLLLVCKLRGNYHDLVKRLRLNRQDFPVTADEAMRRARSAASEAMEISSTSQRHTSSAARAIAEADALLAGGQVSYASDDYDRAVELNDAAVQRYVANFGECHLKSAIGLHKLGRAYEMSVDHSHPPLADDVATQQLQHAECCYRRVITTRSKLLGWGHSDTVMAARDLVDVLAALVRLLPANRAAYITEIASLSDEMAEARRHTEAGTVRNEGDVLVMGVDGLQLQNDDGSEDDGYDGYDLGDGGSDVSH